MQGWPHGLAARTLEDAPSIPQARPRKCNAGAVQKALVQKLKKC